jgi:cysteinyl-tRNA synthetase
MNLTDVDDKTIRGCRTAGIALAEFTKPFKKAFFEDLDSLRIRRANHFPEATAPNYIARMIEMIAVLIERGSAYRAEDGSAYFRIRSFPRYGALAHFNVDELQSTDRVRSDEYEKEEAGDFALWKAWDQEDGDVWWESPWGRGRPGWHIECSAMATALLGPQIDIHCGGEDNIFPHHEAEIAQTECVTNVPFVRLWMHCKHLLVDGRKMSKSENNFFTLRDLMARGWTGREVRFVLAAVKYREPLNFTFESLEAARKALSRYDEWSDRLKAMASAEAEPLPDELAPGNFGEALDDDLNVSAALGAIFELIRDSNRLVDAGRLTPGRLVPCSPGVRSLSPYWPSRLMRRAFQTTYVRCSHAARRRERRENGRSAMRCAISCSRLAGKSRIPRKGSSFREKLAARAAAKWGNLRISRRPPCR